jgi:hypothetical protein
MHKTRFFKLLENFQCFFRVDLPARAPLDTDFLVLMASIASMNFSPSYSLENFGLSS